ncbi:MAG: class I adenylate-forming enzyme family protein [archaeon]
MLPKELIRRSALKYKENTAFVCNKKRVSYYEFNLNVNKLGNALFKSGLSKGDHIGVLLPNCIEFIESRFACYKSGMVFVPINIRMFNFDSIIKLLAHSKCSAAIIYESFRNEIELLRKSLPKIKIFIFVTEELGDYERYIDFIKKGSSEEPKVNLNEREITAICYSSGTTGDPKGIISTHRNWMYSLHNLYTNSDTGITEKDTMLHLTPLTHATSIFLLPFFMKGSKQVIMEQYNPKEIINTIKKEKVTATFLVPPMMLGLLKETYKPWFLFNNYILRNNYFETLNTMIYGSAPISINHLKRCIKRFGMILEQGYGMAEAFPPLANLKRGEHRTKNEEDQRRLFSTGKVVKGVKIKIINNKGKEAKPLETGKIIIKSKTVTIGYLKQEALTRRVYKRGWFYSNDMGFFDEEGYLYILGRIDDIIIKRGLNVHPKQIEDLLYSHPLVEECCVFGIPDLRFGEEIAAAIIKKGEVSEQEILDFCRENINPFLVPKLIEFHNTIPRNSNGKIDRNSLKKKFWEGYNREEIIKTSVLPHTKVLKI